MTTSKTSDTGGRSHGWSPEQLTLLGTILVVGIGLAGFMFSIQQQVRADIHTLESFLRDDIGTVETRLGGDVEAMETRLGGEVEAMETRITTDLDRREARMRAVVRESCGDGGEFRERVSHVEDRFVQPDAAAPRSYRAPGGTSSS